MNGIHHQDMTRATCELMGISSPLMVVASSTPDTFNDVVVSVHEHSPESNLLGHQLTSLQHFEPGYCWKDDVSLGPVETLGDLGMRMSHMYVSVPPNTPEDKPISVAVKNQPKTPLSEFKFPSASLSGSFCKSKDPTLIGQLLHFVQDACVPHHAWGVLWFGHQEWEDDIQNQWLQHRKMISMSGDPDLLKDTFGKEVTKEVFPDSLEDLIKSNADWARKRFGKPHKMAECKMTDMLAVNIRAVAASMMVIRILTGNV